MKIPIATSTRCRCCGQPMRSDIQMRVNGKPPMTLITCDNRDCRMFGYTLTAEPYATLDLTPYLKPRKGS